MYICIILPRSKTYKEPFGTNIFYLNYIFKIKRYRFIIKFEFNIENLLLFLINKRELLSSSSSGVG